MRAALPGLLRQLIASPACTPTVFEDGDWAQARVVSFACGLFLRDAVIDDYLAAPYPGLISAALAAMLDGGRPLLTLDEIRHANSGAGLTLAVFPIPLGQHGWDAPEVEQLRRLAPQALMRAVGGYRLRAIYYEVFTDEVARYIQAGGYRLLHDFSVQAGTGFLRPDSRPRMLRLSHVVPHASPHAPRGLNGATRGVERRRAAIEYLRQNMHELRPVESGGVRRPGAGQVARG